MKIFLYYLLLINLFGFILMYIDKRKSMKGRWRIPEKNLFITAIAFGSLGIFLGMRAFRHKTKHNSFVFGIPFIMVVQVVGLASYLTK